MAIIKSQNFLNFTPDENQRLSINHTFRYSELELVMNKLYLW